MKRVSIIVGLLMIAILTSIGCEVEKTTAFGLTIEDAILAREKADGTLVPAKNGVFKRGENVNMVLLNVGKFKKGKDGKHWFDINIEVKDSNGKIILSKQNLLGENGHIFLPNNVAPSPYGIFTTTPKLKPGTYGMKLTIYDKIGKGSASKNKTFTLQ